MIQEKPKVEFKGTTVKIGQKAIVLSSPSPYGEEPEAIVEIIMGEGYLEVRLESGRLRSLGEVEIQT